MNSPPAARGSQEMGFTQPQDHSFAQPCTCLLWWAGCVKMYSIIGIQSPSHFKSPLSDLAFPTPNSCRSSSPVEQYGIFRSFLVVRKLSLGDVPFPLCTLGGPTCKCKLWNSNFMLYDLQVDLTGCLTGNGGKLSNS